MNCNAQSAASLPAPQTFDATWTSAFARLRTLWDGHQQRNRQLRAMAVFADIDAHTLCDIGAPNWVVAEAKQRGDSRSLRLIDLYRS